MNKPKTIDAYYCDYCGNECDSTPDLVLPTIEDMKYFATYRGVKLYEFTDGKKIVAKQVDVCPECQVKIAKILNTLPTMTT